MKSIFASAAKFVLPTLALAVAIIGCGGSGGSGSGTGTLSVELADAPDPSITAINVTIDRVEAHVNNQWIEVSNTPVSVNLLNLTDTSLNLGSATLPAGDYTQIRLFTSSATVTDADGEHDVEIPSALNTGIKLNINYTISPDTVTTILLDFNVGKSFNKTGSGQYKLQPVIPAVVKVLSGTITGTTKDENGLLSDVQVKAIYTAGSSYALGTEVNTSASMDDGGFKVWALLPGTYTLEFSWTDPDTLAEKTATVTDVVVNANEETAVGEVTLTAAP